MRLSVSQTQKLNNYMKSHPQISREKAIQQLFGGGALHSKVRAFQ